METAFIHVFVSVNIIFAILDVILARLCLIESSNKDRALAACLVSAAVTIAAYVVGIYCRNYFAFSLFNSIYFVAIDWSLFLFFIHTCKLVQNDNVLLLNLKKVFGAYVIFDSAIELINPFKEIAISYSARNTVLNSFIYEKMFLYNVHLFMSYVILAAIVVLLIYKSISTPREYRDQYTLIIVGMVIIVGINALFLFIPGDRIYNILDTSIIAYSFVAYFVYYATYRYADNFLLKDLSRAIIQKSDSGVILFDFNDQLILTNERVRKMLHGINLDKYNSLNDFLKEADITEDVLKRDNYAFQYAIKDDDRGNLKCEHNILRGKNNERLGHLFVFMVVDKEADELTGFHNFDDFVKFYRNNQNRFIPPFTILEMDIENLSAINSRQGRDVGDMKIMELSGLMRDYLPKDSYLIRDAEANLIAISSADNSTIHESVKEIEKKFSSFFTYTAVEVKSEDEDLLNVIDICARTLDIEKMLDMSSSHSDILVSLIKALQECDKDIEEHVKRTQILGARLAKRLGLSDYEKASLSLLCLLHDIGKIGIPIEVLNKPGKLSEEEFALIKTHAEKGYQITDSTKEFRCISKMVLHHHERWDGKGYPSGLAKEEIPLLSRIIAVVDSYDAMTSDRSYRKKKSVAEAVNELKEGSGIQFDPYIVDQFIEMITSEETYSDMYSIPEKLFKELKNEEKEVISHPILNTKLVNYSRYILDSKMMVVEADYNFYTITGYSDEDIKNRSIHQIDLVPEEDQADYLLLVNEILAKHQVAFTKHRLRRKDGSLKNVMCIGRVYYDSVAKDERSEIFICDIPE